MKTWKKSKRQRRAKKVLKGKLFRVSFDGFDKDEMLRMKLYAKELGMSSVSELVKHALIFGMKQKNGTVAWNLKDGLDNND